VSEKIPHDVGSGAKMSSACTQSQMTRQNIRSWVKTFTKMC